MMIEEYAKCDACGHAKALTHYDTGGLVNWVACPKCKTFAEFGKVVELPDDDDTRKFWKNVREDTEWAEDIS